MAPRFRQSKYTPLADYLVAQPAGEVRLTLAEIEQIIGVPLSAWAHYPPFWTNSARGLFRRQPWVRAGWRVVRTDLRSETPAVHFARVAPRAAD
jgi:hypothetical protein